jgi:hypothetical protein
VEHFHDEASYEDLLDLVVDGFVPIFGKTAQQLLDRSCIRPDVK